LRNREQTEAETKNKTLDLYKAYHLLTALYLVSPGNVIEPPMLFFAPDPFGNPWHGIARIDSELGFDYMLSTFTSISENGAFSIDRSIADYDKTFLEETDVHQIMINIIGMYEKSIELILADKYLPNLVNKEAFTVPIYRSTRTF